MQDLGAELLDVAVHLAHPRGIRVQRLDALLGQRRQHQVQRHGVLLLESVARAYSRRRRRVLRSSTSGLSGLARRADAGRQIDEEERRADEEQRREHDVGKQDRDAHGVVRLRVQHLQQEPLRDAVQQHERGEPADRVHDVPARDLDRSPESGAEALGPPGSRPAPRIRRAPARRRPPTRTRAAGMRPAGTRASRRRSQ